jgi:hypothetical protein
MESPDVVPALQRGRVGDVLQADTTAHIGEPRDLVALHPVLEAVS